MKTPKKLGIWMDHTEAHIIKFKSNAIASNTIESLSLQGENKLNHDLEEFGAALKGFVTKSGTDHKQ